MKPRRPSSSASKAPRRAGRDAPASDKAIQHLNADVTADIPASENIASGAGSLLQFVLRQAKIKTNVGTRQISSQGYELVRRVVPDYNLIYVTHGKAVWVIGDTPYPLATNDLVIVPPGIPHHAFSQSQEIDLTSLHLEITLPGGQDAFDLLTPPTFQHVPAKSRLDQYLRGYSEEFQRNNRFMTGLIIPGWGRIIGCELLWHDAKLNLLTAKPIEPLITLTLEELHNRLTQDVTLDDMARWSGYTPQHLNRVFRKVLGVTPLQHLTRIRMEKAAELLAEQTLTVAAIAQAVGYEDAYYFSRLFKQHYRLSPAHYRESLENR